MPSNAPSTPEPRRYKGTGYWVVQLLACLVFFVLSLAAALFLMLAPLEVLSPTAKPREYGIVMLLLVIALVFAVTFAVMLRRYLRMSKEQRAVYAWAVMQQHGSRRDAHPVNPAAAVNDIAILSTAKRARNGELTASEIRELQALRPDVPYPGALPPDGDRT